MSAQTAAVVLTDGLTEGVHLRGQHVRQRRGAVADGLHVEEACASYALRHEVRHRIPVCTSHIATGWCNQAQCWRMYMRRLNTVHSDEALDMRLQHVHTERLLQ